MMQKRKRIALIGGGMSGLTAVYEITKTPNWRQKYDIDIYQLGWRIGGKGASGVNPKVGKRIEEHGLHIWFGCYNNAFNLIEECYESLGETTSPLKSVDDAFKPHSFVPITEKIHDEWQIWNLHFPTNDHDLGGHDTYLPLWDYVKMTLMEASRQLKEAIGQTQKNCSESPEHSLNPLDDVAQYVSNLFVNQGEFILEKVLVWLDQLEKRVGQSQQSESNELLDLIDNLQGFVKNTLADWVYDHTILRRAFLISDSLLTIVRGILRDNLVERGLDAVNNEEFRDWLLRHGAADITASSGIIRAFYNLWLAYEKGDIDRPTCEAGSAVRMLFRLIFSYKGAFMWKMQAGMGDTIFTPIYELFSQYKSSENQGGITFKFFHKVKNLGLSADKKQVETMLVEEQATLKDPSKPYDPFLEVKGWGCWPTEPNYDQLVEGEELKAKNINLESYWTTWKGKDKTLRQGEDYDTIILNTPVACLQHICPELVNANPKWLDMILNVKTVQTQAYQIWLNKSLEELGWPYQTPIMTSHAQPVDTWADMSHLNVREDFPEEHEPKKIAYFCGVLPDAESIPPFSVQGFQESQDEVVRQNLINFVEKDATFLWRKAARPNSKGLDYNTLIDTEDREGVERVNGQFWTANVDPHARYTLLNPGSSEHRLKTDETGFDNLYITGDWIQNSLNFGCIEGCVMSGMMTARAITGEPIHIVGENLWA